jgi:GT2 family glycosyltransferase
MKKPLSIILPTYDNPDYLIPCVTSIFKTGVHHVLADIVIVNNGKQNMERTFGKHESLKVLEPGKNLGWEGGLQYAVERTETPFLCFQNDDTLLPVSSVFFYQRLLAHFMNDKVAAVGPATTCAGSVASIFHPQTVSSVTKVPYLIFFCTLIRRLALEKVGGIDTSLPGGDDFDLSIRFRKAGYDLLIDPYAFIYHHGFKTGTRIHGDHNVEGGWNSMSMVERTNKALIQKHGFKNWFGTIKQFPYEDEIKFSSVDKEGDVVRSLLNGEKSVLELGCGAQKTVPNAIGVDRVPSGKPLDALPHMISIADVQADVQNDLPFKDESQDAIIARHILEHCVDAIKAIKGWRRVLRPGGKLIIAVPDERITQSIPLNIEHVHAFSPESLKNLLEVCGFKEVKTKDPRNGASFVACYERLN